MTQRRKISTRKVLQSLITLLVIVGGVFAIVSASKSAADNVVKDIQLQVLEGETEHLDKAAIWQDLIAANHIVPGRTRTADIDFQELERTAYRHEWIGKAEVWLDNQQVLHILLTPAHPEAHIFFKDGTGAYIDSNLRFLPAREVKPAYATIVTGFPTLRTDSLRQAIAAQTLFLVKTINQDTFWFAQVDHLAVLPDNSFEIVPVLGRQRILLGDTSRLQQKLSNLFTFYKQVLNVIGWDKYEVIDLRFNGQVVASPALPKPKSLENATSNMTWLQSVMLQAGKDSIYEPAMPIAFRADNRQPSNTAPKNEQLARVTKAPIPAPKSAGAPKHKNQPASKSANTLRKEQDEKATHKAPAPINDVRRDRRPPDARPATSNTARSTKPANGNASAIKQIKSSPTYKQSTLKKHAPLEKANPKSRPKYLYDSPAPTKH